MAQYVNNTITEKLRGAFGKQIVFRQWGGKTILSKAPGPRKGRPTKAQAATQDKFLAASRYGKSVVRRPDKSLAQAYAQVLKPRQNVYSRAVEDFLTVPVVNFIDTLSYKGVVGDHIVIRAMDDFRVTGVKLEIYAPDGLLLETGNAQQNINGIDWTYVATQTAPSPAGSKGSKVKAIASDVPGNEGVLEIIV